MLTLPLGSGMPSEGADERTTRQPRQRSPTRRTFLGAAGAAGVLGLSGCLSDIGGGGSSGTVTYGIVSPMSGAYSSLAPGQRNGAELAVETINDSDEFGFEVEMATADTETDPESGTQAARRVIQQDGADYLMGAISSSVAGALNGVAADEGVIYNPGAAAVNITGELCNEWVFRAETNTAQVAEAVSAYTVNNLGTNVWFHVADYAYGDSVLMRTSERMEEENDSFEKVGESRSELGASNYDSFITEIANSDADVVVLGMTGGDLITFVGQAAEQGLKEEVNLMAPTMSFQVVRGALGQAAVGTYGGVRYVSTLDTGDNPSFAQAYSDAYDGPPDNFARVGYQSLMMTAQGIEEAGSTDPADVKDVLPGLTVSSIYGDIQFRECDHQALNPTWMCELVAGDGEMADVELLSKVEGPDAIPPCEESGCSL